jgi:hypothetical protein
MGLNQRIIIGLIVISLIIPASYLFGNYDRGRSLISGHLIEVAINGKPVSYLGADVIGILTAQEFHGDRTAKGPTLLYAMEAAGIGEFKSIEVRGLANASCSVARNELGPDFVLCPTGNGTVDLIRRTAQHPIVKNVSQINAIN